jgi:Fe2+ or Zn2+ uptake regulation protein
MAANRRDIDEILTNLRANGERITTARRVVLQVLLNEPHEHLTMDELADRVADRAPDIHLSTIYRTVEFLEEAGVLAEVRVGASPAVYHFASDTHHHARCDSCGAVIELPAGVFDSVSKRLQREHGFHAHLRHIVIPGICQRCASG